jgi:hypothetical protein
MGSLDQIFLLIYSNKLKIYMFVKIYVLCLLFYLAVIKN